MCTAWDMRHLVYHHQRASPPLKHKKSAYRLINACFGVNFFLSFSVSDTIVFIVTGLLGTAGLNSSTPEEETALLS